MAPLLLLLICLLGREVFGEDVPKLDPKVDKRQTQYIQDQQQYAQERQAAPQLPPEYLSLLQQIEAQGIPARGQPEYQQVVISKAPQRFVGQPPRRPPPRLSPQAEEQRRLQEAVAQKSIREQEVRDEQRQQQAQIQQFYQQQGIDPQYLRQIQIDAAQQQQLQAAQQLQAQQAQQYQAAQQQYQPQQQYVQVPQPQYVRPAPAQPAPQPQYVRAAPPPQPAPQPQYIQQIPERVSYSQVRFGTTKLAPQPQRARAQPQVYVQPQVYAQPQQVVYRQPVVYEQQKTAVVDQKQTPEQYLIETTKPGDEDPRQRQVYFRPQPNYEEVAQQAQYQQVQEVSTPSPSRSAIFVSTSRTPVALKPTYAKQQIEEVRLPKTERRLLSQDEVNALINAGFKVTPSQQYEQQYEQPAYYRGIGKRQNKPIPRPVPLTEQERQHLARQGITNLYRVDTAESRDAPPTYVLAIGGPSQTKA